MALTAKPKRKSLVRVPLDCLRVIYQLISSSMALSLFPSGCRFLGLGLAVNQKKVSPAAARSCKPYIAPQCMSGLTSAPPISLLTFVYSAASAADTAFVTLFSLMGVDGLQRTPSLQRLDLRCHS
jgi:hypothetical protein